MVGPMGFFISLTGSGEDKTWNFQKPVMQNDFLRIPWCCVPEL
jgi:hypothetical protein